MIKIELINKQEIFERISNGIPYGKNLKPYSKIQVDTILDDFIEEEQYEKCQIIHDFIQQRFPV